MDKYTSLIVLSKLKRKLKNFEVPKFYPYCNNLKFPICIRTSPSKSLPGVLKSSFGILNSEEANQRSIEMFDFFHSEKVSYMKKLLYPKEALSLKLIYQEEIQDGIYGVFHSHTPLGVPTLNYTASEKHSEVVSHGKGNCILKQEIVDVLQSVSDSLVDMYNCQIEAEFIIKDDKVYIVQFRMLPELPIVESKSFENKGELLCKGEVKVAGVVEASLKEVLFRNEISEDEEYLLEGKKAVIFTEEIHHCHLLVLCRKMKIPAIVCFDVENIVKEENIFIDCFNGEICKIK